MVKNKSKSCDCIITLKQLRSMSFGFRNMFMQQIAKQKEEEKILRLRSERGRK